MAVAYAAKNDVPKALDYVGKALESGMPIERFIAGPRDLLKNLVESEAFLEFANPQNVKLVHGPMLGDVTPTSAKIWLRTDREASVTVILLEDGKEQRRKIEGNTSGINDYTSIIRISGLEHATSYSYGISVDGIQLFENGSLLDDLLINDCIN